MAHKSWNTIHDLADVNARFGCATAKFVPSAAWDTHGVKDLLAASEGKGLDTVVVKCDVSSVLADRGDARIACVDPETNTMTVVYPVHGDVFPDGVHHSKSVACILWREDENTGTKEVLLVTEKKRDYTSFVAGGLKWKETSLQGCVREVREEVGLDLDTSTMQWIATVEMPRAAPYGELNTLTTFACKVDNARTAQIKLQDAEIKDARWYEIDDALGVVPFESARRALRAFAAGKGRSVDWVARKGCTTSWFCDDQDASMMS